MMLLLIFNIIIIITDVFLISIISIVVATFVQFSGDVTVCVNHIYY